MTRSYLPAPYLSAVGAALTLTAGMAGLALLPVGAKPIS